MLALSHYYKHPSGDLIPDPDMTLQVLRDAQTAKALTYQDKYRDDVVYPDSDSFEGEDTNNGQSLVKYQLVPTLGACYYQLMRVIAKSMLRTFWESSPKYRDAKKQMTEWYNYCSNAQWNSPHELKADLRNASILKNNRVVFNVCGNKYRIVVLTDYSRHGMLIRFAGTHKQYDEIEDIEKL